MKKIIRLLLATGWLVSSLALASDSVSQPAIVILIDDMGDNLAKGQAAIELPGPVTYAVLPHSPHGQFLANQATHRGKEVMLHAPMENTQARPLGPGALTQALDKTQFVKILRDDLDSVPGVLGLNNHMGSLLTGLRQQMEWVMEVARERQIFFIDSRTTADSVAWKVAREQGIPYLRRDVFLDHERTTEFVDQQFQQTIRIARQQGAAVAIGHPYPTTIAYLQEALPKLDELGIRLVSASALLMERRMERQRAAYYQRQKKRAEEFMTVALCNEDGADCRAIAP